VYLDFIGNLVLFPVVKIYFENWLRFDDVTAISLEAHFFETRCTVH